MQKYLTIFSVTAIFILGLLTAGTAMLSFALWELPPIGLSGILMVVRWVVGFSALFSFYVWATE